MKSVLALLALVIGTVMAACGSEGPSNTQFPCNVLSVSGMCAVHRLLQFGDSTCRRATNNTSRLRKNEEFSTRSDMVK